MTVGARAPGSTRPRLGWQYALVHPDPGPPPKRPTLPEQEHVPPEWVDVQCRQERELNRPLVFAAALALTLALLFGLLGWPLGALPGWGAAVAIGFCLVLAGVAAYAVWQGEQALRMRLAEERNRLDRARAERERRLHAAQEDHAHRFDAWRARKADYDAQPEWYSVTLPAGTSRLDVVGGTPAGWQAMLTTVGSPVLESGGRVTVVDLSDGAAAGDLTAVALDRGPQVRVLPRDLARLDVGAGLDAGALADVLALLGCAGEQDDSRDALTDTVLLERVLDVLGDRASVPQVAAALRIVAGAGDANEDVACEPLTPEQLDRLRHVAGRGLPKRVTAERARVLEPLVRELDDVGSRAGPTPRSQLHVVSVDPRRGSPGTTALDAYVVGSLAHELHRMPPREPWSHVMFVCGGERLRVDLLDRLTAACVASGTGLVVMYGSAPPHVRRRLLRGAGSALALMRAGDLEDARTAGEYLGFGCRLALGRLTETVGAAAASTDEAYPAVPDRKGSDGAPTPPLREVSTATAWGRITARELAEAGRISGTVRGSRELVVGESELRRLPPSAFILTYQSTYGRRAVLGDANPAIASLPHATARELDEFSSEAGTTADGASRTAAADRPAESSASRRESSGEDRTPREADRRQARSSGPDSAPTREELVQRPPNLGPPPERPDWRRGR